MADRGHELTDEILNKLEARIADEYAVATRDMKRKLREYMEKFKEDDKKQKALLKAGKITKKEYKDWRRSTPASHSTTTTRRNTCSKTNGS